MSGGGLRDLPPPVPLRPQQIDYHKSSARPTIDSIYKRFEHRQSGKPPLLTLEEIATEHLVPLGTIQGWASIFSTDPEWRPYMPRARKPRCFTTQQEENFLQHIRTKFLLPKLLLTRPQMIAEARNWWEALPAAQRRTAEAPKLSPKWALGFMQRCHLSLRKMRYAKRPTIIDNTPIREFAIELEACRATYGENRVLNMDETSWRLIQPSTRIVGVRGAEIVAGYVKGNAKECFTAVGTIAADGTKYPMYYIAKGTTKGCCKQYGPTIQRTRISFSESGWMTETVMKQYLRWLRQQAPEGTLCLFCDCFDAHWTAEVRSEATKLDIDLRKIPEGMTDLLQPCDRRVFGVLKSISRRDWNEMYVRSPNTRWNRKLGAQLLESAWEQVPVRVILDGWDIRDPDNMPADDDMDLADDEIADDDEYIADGDEPTDAEEIPLDDASDEEPLSPISDSEGDQGRREGPPTEQEVHSETESEGEADIESLADSPVEADSPDNPDPGEQCLQELAQVHRGWGSVILDGVDRRVRSRRLPASEEWVRMIAERLGLAEDFVSQTLREVSWQIGVTWTWPGPETARLYAVTEQRLSELTDTL